MRWIGMSWPHEDLSPDVGPNPTSVMPKPTIPALTSVVIVRPPCRHHEDSLSSMPSSHAQCLVCCTRMGGDGPGSHGVNAYGGWVVRPPVKVRTAICECHWAALLAVGCAAFRSEQARSVPAVVPGGMQIKLLTGGNAAYQARPTRGPNVSLLVVELVAYSVPSCGGAFCMRSQSCRVLSV